MKRLAVLAAAVVASAALLLGVSGTASAMHVHGHPTMMYHHG